MGQVIRKTNEKIQREAVRKLKTACGKKTLFRIPGEGKRGDWRTILSPYSPVVASHLRSAYPNVIIANEDIAAAAAAWTLVYEDSTFVAQN